MSHLPARTLGDGMEVTPNQPPEIRQPYSEILQSMTPVPPGDKVINLVPKYVSGDKKVGSKSLSMKPKEPKFIPYEPYKGAVQPMGVKKKPLPVRFISNDKNNIEIHQLVDQMSEMRLVEMNKLKADLNKDEIIPRKQWEKEKAAYETDIKNLKETKAHLENQLKFQAQVNGELKTLLVAAVGEDLESRVQHLTEDKLSLARALLNSANHLTSHQEQTEWLSGQCEVWRSKFLASSLMVEELARWKSALTKRTSDLQEVVKLLLGDSLKMHQQMSQLVHNLSLTVAQLQGSSPINHFEGDLLELSSRVVKLSEDVAKSLKLSIGKPEQPKSPKHTQTEKLALKVLKNPVSLTSQDKLCSALVGAAHSLTGDQKFLQNPYLHPCCSHCKGDVHEI